MNNEPVAWMCIETDDEGEFRSYSDDEPQWLEGYIPLYTHPAKTLTDEEILNVAFCSEVSTVAIENDWDGTVIEFARAILRKAQEK